MNPQIPHMRTVIAFCAVAIAFYGGFSIWVVMYSGDAALLGDTIGTWKSFATAAFFFWVGASSGGKLPPTGPVPENVAEAAKQVAGAADRKRDEIVGDAT